MLQLKSPPGKYSVSKWLKSQVLLDISEMEDLFSHLSFPGLYNVSEIKPLDHLQVSMDDFLSSYITYIEQLKSGQVPSNSKQFSSALSVDEEALYAQEISPNKFMAKPVKPLIQLQQHRFFFSKTAGNIQPMVMSAESIHWGIQFSYPQIFHDGIQGTFTKVTDEAQFPNTTIFKKFLKWSRDHTSPTTFVHENKVIATSLRLGKKCFEWIDRHAQLNSQGLQVHVY